MNGPKTDFPTLVAISAFSLMLTVALHEHGGHTLACAALGGRLKELGAFYVDCDRASISGLENRLVALAGPLASLLGGIAGMFFFDRSPRTNSQLKYFLWHFATVNLMTATGYLLFSGVLGIGDLGMDPSGVFYQVQPEWIYRVALSAVGLISYLGIVRLALRKIDTFIGGEGQERVQRAQALSFTSYLTGGIVAVLIGFLNPHGLLIVLISSVASCLGGTSGLAWMMQMLDRQKVTGTPPFVLERNWSWILSSLIFVLAYAIVLGPTIYPR